MWPNARSMAKSSLSEKRDGLIAALLERPDIEDLSMRLVARGDAKAGRRSSSCRPATQRGRMARRPGSRMAPRRGYHPARHRRPGAAGTYRRCHARTDRAQRPGGRRRPDRTLSELKLNAGTLGVEASARYDRTADRLEGVITVHAAEPGTLGPFVGGVTWRGLRIETKADLSGLSARPRARSRSPAVPTTFRSPCVDKRMPALGAVTLAADLGLGG